MRWIVAPLVAAVALAGSLFLDALEITTRASVRLGQASERAPRVTEQARAEVSTLPAIADLTAQQADAFKGLADALEVSAARVERLGKAVNKQLSAVRGLKNVMGTVDDSLGCARRRLAALVEVTRAAPRALADINATMQVLLAAQDKSVRHLRSINRKLSALGVVAGVSDVRAPPPPGGVPAPTPSGRGGPVDCG